jgi:hypothetical protein
MTPGTDAPPLSVVLACRDPWPALRAALDALYHQAAAARAEIVVAVARSDARPPDAPTRYPGVLWTDVPGASVFQLRAAAIARARGAVVGLTEDHARVENGWCAAVLAAHAERPDAAAVGGVVENASTDTLRDWASFLLANGPAMRPLRPTRGEPISQQANVSYKRRVLPATFPPEGFMTLTFHEQLRRRGERLVADERLVAHHDQALSLRAHSAGHFHNGRSIAGFRRAHLGRMGRLAYAAGCIALPAVMLVRTSRTVVSKRRNVGLAAACVPWVVWLLLCHTAGELVGYVAGAGRSPHGVN